MNGSTLICTGSIVPLEARPDSTGLDDVDTGGDFEPRSTITVRAEILSAKRARGRPFNGLAGVSSSVARRTCDVSLIMIGIANRMIARPARGPPRYRRSGFGLSASTVSNRYPFFAVL